MNSLGITRTCLGGLILLSTLALSQSATPKYDPKSEIQFRGTVAELRAAADAKSDIHLAVKADAETYDVDLCPKAFLEEAEMSFAANDEIQVTGSKTTVKDNVLILAREIVKGDEKLVLRDKNGGPVWIWLKK